MPMSMKTCPDAPPAERLTLRLPHKAKNKAKTCFRAQNFMQERCTTKMRKCRCMKFLCIISGCPAGARKWHISYFAMLLHSKKLPKHLCFGSFGWR